MNIQNIIHCLLFSCLVMPLVSEAKDYKKLGIPTGSSTGTYIKFGNNIKEIVEKEHKKTLEIWVRESKGSVQNIEMLASKGENAAFAIVQSDVISHLRKHADKKYKNHAKNLRLIFPFYNEEVHLLGKKNIKSISDLDGKKVIVGPFGSGTSLTAWNLMHLVGVKPKKIINTDYDDAINMIVNGKADAMFSVSGKPVDIFTRLSEMSTEKAYEDEVAKIHFVPLDEKIMLSEYVEGELTAKDYPMLKETIPTVAVKAVLVAFDFSKGETAYYKQRCSQLKKIADTIRANINDLKTNKQNKWHKKWKEVNLSQNLAEWKKDPCSHPNASLPESDPVKQPSFKCRINPNAPECK